MHAVIGDGRVLFFLEAQNLVTNCTRNLAKSTTKYHVTGIGLENYIMAFIRLHLKKEILLSLLMSCRPNAIKSRKIKMDRLGNEEENGIFPP